MSTTIKSRSEMIAMSIVGLLDGIAQSAGPEFDGREPVIGLAIAFAQVCSALGMSRTAALSLAQNVGAPPIVNPGLVQRARPHGADLMSPPRSPRFRK